ncbi:hypothetical protein RHMOL_Rhmol05G0214400 [Rhododendron molle]|uniref:Uncharacterized protein n=1 Tax=Rhododendron molle TaxID=49168 RepID=A0ACC0NRM9_RHOML|nr:hypothetical protein RHMOL_Rhmol05G0214400 [Rhododendron molle]
MLEWRYCRAGQCCRFSLERSSQARRHSVGHGYSGVRVQEARLGVTQTLAMLERLNRFFTHLLDLKTKSATKYYASATDLTGGKNTRALFGICLNSHP